jgi:hypothetical protein
MASATEIARFNAVDRRAGLLEIRRGIAQQAGREPNACSTSPWTR